MDLDSCQIGRHHHLKPSRPFLPLPPLSLRETPDGTPASSPLHSKHQPDPTPSSTHQPLLDLTPIIHRPVRRVRQQIPHPPLPLSLSLFVVGIDIPSPPADPERLLLQCRSGVVGGAQVDALVEGEEGLFFYGGGGLVSFVGGIVGGKRRGGDWLRTLGCGSLVDGYGSRRYQGFGFGFADGWGWGWGKMRERRWWWGMVWVWVWVGGRV